MDCKKTQQLFDDLWHQRLTPETDAQVRQHLADCTDCRVLEQRSARLQRLLALKRYERPAPAYFDNFLSEFHRRLLTEMARDHLAAMAGTVNSIQRTLAPVLVSLGGATAQGRPVTGLPTWQDAAESLFQAARRLELLLASALGVTQESSVSDRVPSDLMAALADLRANLEQLERLLPQ